MNEWIIQSRAHGCQSCGKTFVDKQSYHTVLSDEKRDLTRLDVCPECWQAQFSQAVKERKGFISHWQGVYEAPPAAPVDAIQKDTAETLLRKIILLNNPKYVASGFILAVMLERKRLLKVKEQFKRDGRRVFIYEHPKTGDLFTIPDPNLQLNQLEQVQHDVAHLLEHGLPEEVVLPPIPVAVTADAAPTEPGSTAPVSESTAPTPVSVAPLADAVVAAEPGTGITPPSPTPESGMALKKADDQAALPLEEALTSTGETPPPPQPEIPSVKP